MRSPALVIVGVIVALLGLLFTLQGVGLVKGSFMSDTTFWTVAGPVIILIGLALAASGARGRVR